MASYRNNSSKNSLRNAGNKIMDNNISSNKIMDNNKNNNKIMDNITDSFFIIKNIDTSVYIIYMLISIIILLSTIFTFKNMAPIAIIPLGGALASAVNIEEFIQAIGILGLVVLRSALEYKMKI